MTYIWWGHQNIQHYWIKVIDLIKLITGIEIRNNPFSLLLFMIFISAHALKSSLVSFLIIAAKTIIPRLWRSPQPPSVTDWFIEIFSVWKS